MKSPCAVCERPSGKAMSPALIAQLAVLGLALLFAPLIVRRNSSDRDEVDQRVEDVRRQLDLDSDEPTER